MWSFATDEPRMLDRSGAGPILFVESGGAVVAVDDGGMGAELWRVALADRTYNAVVIAPDDTVVASSYAAPPWLGLIDRIDADGNTLSSEQAIEDSYIAAIGVLPSGEIVVSWFLGESIDAHVALFSPDGTSMLWQLAHEGPTDTIVYGLDVDDLGRIAYVWSEQLAPNQGLEYVTKLDPSGVEIWTAELDQGNNETPVSVVFGPDGSVITAMNANNGATAVLHKFSP